MKLGSSCGLLVQPAAQPSGGAAQPAALNRGLLFRAPVDPRVDLRYLPLSAELAAQLRGVSSLGF